MKLNISTKFYLVKVEQGSYLLLRDIVFPYKHWLGRTTQHETLRCTVFVTDIYALVVYFIYSKFLSSER